jgi:hypothetical protein
MNDKFKKVNDILEFVAILVYCYMIFYSISNSFAYQIQWPAWWAQTWNVSVMICTLMAAYKIYLNFDSRRVQAIICLVMLIIAVITRLVSSVDYLGLIAATIMFFNVDYRRILKALICSLSTFLVISLVCSLIGIIPNNTQFLRGQTRYSLGYVEHNGFMLYFFILVLGISLAVRKYKLLFGIVTILVTAILFHFTGSVTSSTVLVLFAMFTIANALIKKRDSALRKVFDLFLKVLTGLPIYCLLILLGSTFYFNSLQTDELTNTYWARIYWIDKALEEANFPMPYQNYEKTDVKFNLLWGVAGSDKIFPGETLYMGLFIRWGLLLLIPCMAFLLLGAYKTHKKRQYSILFVILSLALIGISEAPHYNVACAAFYCIFIASHKTLKRTKKASTPRRSVSYNG